MLSCMHPGVWTWDSRPDFQVPGAPLSSTEFRSVPTFWGAFPSLQGQDGFGWDQKCKGTSLEQWQPGRRSTQQQRRGGCREGTQHRDMGRKGHRENLTQEQRHRGTKAAAEQREVIEDPSRSLTFGGPQEEDKWSPQTPNLPPFLPDTSSCTVKGHMRASGQLCSCIQAPLTTFLTPPPHKPPCTGHPSKPRAVYTGAVGLQGAGPLKRPTPSQEAGGPDYPK